MGEGGELMEAGDVILFAFYCVHFRYNQGGRCIALDSCAQNRFNRCSSLGGSQTDSQYATNLRDRNTYVRRVIFVCLNGWVFDDDLFSGFGCGIHGINNRSAEVNLQ